MANRAWMNFGKSYQNLTSPAMVNLQFTVDATQGEGLSNLQSNGYIKNVFMHSSSPSSDNPNPASGYIWIQLQDNYSKAINMASNIVSPSTGSNLAVTSGAALLTVGIPYIITVIGTTTSAQWHTLGLPAGLTPAVGMSFIALVTGVGAGTGMVKAIGVSSLASIEMIPDPQMELGPQGVSNQGGWIMLQCLKPSVASSSNALTFTGSALASHDHNLIIKGGQASSTTNDVATYAGPLLGKEQATDATILGANSATNGGVVGSSAGTPAGTINTPTITSTVTMVPGAPANNSVIQLSIMLDMSSVTVDGL